MTFSLPRASLPSTAVATTVTVVSAFSPAAARSTPRSSMEAAASAQGLDVTLSQGPNNTIRVTGEIPSLGKVTLQSKLTLGPDNRMQLSAAKVETAIPGLGGRIPRQLDFPIPVGQLPMQLTLQLNNLQTSADGLRVFAEAYHVRITGSGVESG